MGGGGTSLASGDGCGRAWVSDVLGLPDGIAACLFDLDGVLTRTAHVHGAACKQMFDDSLRERAQPRGEPFVRFDAVDAYLAGVRTLDVQPAQAAVFEDALAGAEAGRAGSFGFVVGVDRVGLAEALRAHGTDVVVGDLTELLDVR